jgi:hypothetical protein
LAVGGMTNEEKDQKTKAYQAAYRAANREKLRLYAQKYRQDNPEKSRESLRQSHLKNKDNYNKQRRAKRAANPEINARQCAESYKKHREARLASMKEYAKKNASWFYSRNAIKRTNLQQIIPKWDVELTQLVVDEADDLKQKRKEVTGFAWHLDHVIPIKGKTVCGLHVYNNFAVIPEIVNRRKKNKLLNTDKGPLWFM